MSTAFSVIFDEFEDNLDALQAVVTAFATPGAGPAKARVAAANSVTLLLAATFEEFVREMARTYAKAFVASCKDIDDVPHKLVSLLWRRYSDTFNRMQYDTKVKREQSVAVAELKFKAVHEFTSGNLTLDIYADLIHNENNMRPGEVNSLFTVSKLADVCSKISDKPPVYSYFNMTDSGKVHGLILKELNDFMERRNEVAHAVAMSSSAGSDQLLKDVAFLRAFGSSLSSTLDAHAPKPYAPSLAVVTPTAAATPNSLAKLRAWFTDLW